MINSHVPIYNEAKDTKFILPNALTPAALTTQAPLIQNTDYLDSNSQDDPTSFQQTMLLLLHLLNYNLYYILAYLDQII